MYCEHGRNKNNKKSLMDLIETSRSQWFEVATQFRAVFSSVDGTGMGMAMGTGMGGAGRKAKGGRREEGAAGAGRPERCAPS